MPKPLLAITVVLAMSVLPPVQAKPLSTRLTWGFSGQTLYAPTLNDLNYLGTVYEVPYEWPQSWQGEFTLSACLEDGSETVDTWEAQTKTFPQSTPLPPPDQLQGQIIINAAGAATGQTIINVGTDIAKNRIIAGGGSLPQGIIYRGLASGGAWLGRAVFGWLAVA